MRGSWVFPPRAREVQSDKKRSFVNRKRRNCDPATPADDHQGDRWDHVADDPAHRLILAVVPGARSIENAEAIIAKVEDRMGGASPRLMTGDEYPASASAIEAAFGVPVSGSTTGPGRRPILPERRLPQDLTYAMVQKRRENDRAVADEHRPILGTQGGPDAALVASSVSRAVDTSFVERHHGTDRGQNAREARSGGRGRRRARRTTGKGRAAGEEMSSGAGPGSGCLAGLVTAIVPVGPALVHSAPVLSRGGRGMRRMSFDQDEFDPPDSEQFLELALACPSQHRDLGAFLARCGASAISGRSTDAGWGRWEMVRDHFRRFAGFGLPPLVACREIVLLRDGWDDQELAIMTGAKAVWYHWYTTA